MVGVGDELVQLFKISLAALGRMDWKGQEYMWSGCHSRPNIRCYMVTEGE